MANFYAKRICVFKFEKIYVFSVSVSRGQNRVTIAITQ